MKKRTTRRPAKKPPKPPRLSRAAGGTGLTDFGPIQPAVDAVRNMSRREQILGIVLIAALVVGVLVVILARGGDDAPAPAAAGDATPAASVGPVKPKEGMLSASDVGTPESAKAGQPGSVADVAPLNLMEGGGDSGNGGDLVGPKLDEIGRETWQDVDAAPDGPPAEPKSTAGIDEAAAKLERAADTFEKCVAESEDDRPCGGSDIPGVMVAAVPPDLGKGVVFKITSSDGHELRIIISDGHRCRQLDDSESCIGWAAP